MKIGQFTDSFLPIVDGVGRVVSNYAALLGQRGHETYVITPMQKSGYRGTLPYEIVDFDGMPLPSSPQYRAGMPILDMHYNHRMETVPLEIIHAHSPFVAGQEALRIAKRRRVPVVGTFQSKYYDDFMQITGSRIVSELGTHYVVDFFEHCDEVWTVTHASADVLRDYGYHGEIHVIYNGTPIRPVEEAAVAEVRRRWGLGSAPVLLYVGQQNWKKNLLCTLEAIALLHRSGQELKLVMVGIGPDREAIEKKAAELGLCGDIVFTGLVQEAPILDGLYRTASLFLFPSLYDTAGLVVQEAACMRTPSVVIRGSCAAEVIRDGENGFCCENSPESLCRTIQSALADPERLAAIGRQAQETIPIRWEDVIDRVEERYRALLEKYTR